MSNKTSVHTVCIGVFIHNEESYVGLCLEDLAGQSVFFDANISVQVYLLCNGSTDNSVRVASTIASEKNYTLLDWPEGGKSRTWNRFVHEVVHANTASIVFLDGDIRLPEPDTIKNLLATLNSTSANVTTSQAIKDTSIYARWNPLRLAASVIKRPHQNGSIAGSLYAMQGEVAERIWLPVPCLVEDGFLAATIVTNFFQSTQSEYDLIRATPKARHVFEPPRKLIEFFQHDVRLVLGTELNAALYTLLWASNNRAEIQQLMQDFSVGKNIDSAISEHLRRPENQTFKLKRMLGFAWPEQRLSLKGLIMFPVRFVHMLYMYLVYLSAWPKFKERQFKW